MYTLYVANKNYSSWSLRPWVLMHTLAIPFEERLIGFDQGDNWERFRRFAPNGRVPCLHDGDTIVWDSLGIVEYLSERHPGVWPEDPVARTWARCATSEMHSGFEALRSKCSMSCGVRVRLNAISAALQREIDRVDELWAEGLARFGGPFLAGAAFTAVDAFYAPVVYRALSYDLPLSDAAGAYRDRMLALDAMRQWYDDALAETWRDEAHEAEVASLGQVIADHRAHSA